MRPCNGLKLVLRPVSAAPLGLNKRFPLITPGLAPWALQEYRPCRAHCGQSSICNKLLDLLGDAVVSAVGTILLQSPGWNEGKARNETLGKQGAQELRAP